MLLLPSVIVNCPTVALPENNPDIFTKTKTLFDADDGVIDAPIGKDVIKGPPYNCIDIKLGKPSVTKWQVIDRGLYQTMLNLKPDTGR